MKGCSACGFKGKLDDVANEVVEHHPQWTEEWGDIGWDRYWVVARCPNCLQPNVEQFDWAEHQMEPDDVVMKRLVQPAQPSVLHPLVEEKSLAHHRATHWIEAVEGSVRAVRSLLRQRSGLTADGKVLVTQAFSIRNPRLRFSALATDTEINEQVGFMTLLEGYWRHVRNVISHSDDAEWLNAESAWDLLLLASWICRSIDRCEVTRRP